MPARGPGRYVAPLALIAVILAMVMIVGSSGGDGDEESATSPTASTQTTTGPGGQTRRPPKTYRVREGDTLASIALKTGITEERLSILNPDLDPNAIQVGQRIRLRP